VSYQEASDHSSGSGPASLSKFYNTLVSYSLAEAKQSLIYTAGLNSYITEICGASTMFYGLTGAISKLFLSKALRTSFTSTYNKTTGSDAGAGSAEGADGSKNTPGAPAPSPSPLKEGTP